MGGRGRARRVPRVWRDLGLSQQHHQRLGGAVWWDRQPPGRRGHGPHARLRHHCSQDPRDELEVYQDLAQKAQEGHPERCFTPPYPFQALLCHGIIRSLQCTLCPHPCSEKTPLRLSSHLFHHHHHNHHHNHHFLYLVYSYYVDLGAFSCCLWRKLWCVWHVLWRVWRRSVWWWVWSCILLLRSTHTCRKKR